MLKFFRRKENTPGTVQEIKKPAPKKLLDPEIFRELHALEKYVREKTDSSFFLSLHDDGSINYPALLNHITASWIGKNARLPQDRLIPLTDFDSADYHRFLKIDVPFDDAIRQKCPHVVGDAANFKDLIAPGVRSYIGVAAYYWAEGKANVDTTQMAIFDLSNAIKRGEPIPTPEKAVTQAKDYIEKNYILVSDIQALSDAIFASPAVHDEMGEHVMQGAQIRHFMGEKEALVDALKNYQEKITRDVENPPNAYLVKFVDYMRRGLELNTLSADTVLHTLSDYNSDSKDRQCSKLPDGSIFCPPGDSYDYLMNVLKMTQSVDRGMGWISI